MCLILVIVEVVLFNIIYLFQYRKCFLMSKLLIDIHIRYFNYFNANCSS